jgi:hypothetical protein
LGHSCESKLAEAFMHAPKGDARCRPSNLSALAWALAFKSAVSIFKGPCATFESVQRNEFGTGPFIEASNPCELVPH